MKPVRLAVVGAGHMGRLHATKIAARARERGDAALVAVADLDRERAEEVAAEEGVGSETDYHALFPEVDAVVVAVPTVAHGEVVAAALEAGLDVLVEKPIAANVAEARALLARARERGVLLQVGHLEWFNAAMQTVAERVTRPRFFEGHRLGPFTARATDVDVVRDLIIHDIDIVQRLVGEEPERIDAIGVPVLTEKVDIANARLTFPGGAVANLTASRVSPTPMRKLRFFQPDGYISIDFLEQAVVIAQREAPSASGERKIAIERVAIDRGDALASQLEAFLRGIRERRVEAGDADQGLSALRTALRVNDAMPPLESLL
ncbi:MAG: Gfo/Idh/MocA family oxidoreductase [Myxococcota bacterium]